MFFNTKTTILRSQFFRTSATYARLSLKFLSALPYFNKFLEGIPPFWADLVSAILVGSLAAYWAAHTIRTAMSTRALRGRLSTLSDTLKGLTVSILTCTVLLALFAWNSWLPLNHCLNRTWTLCGTFVSACGKRSCFWLYDQRNRPIEDYCQGLADDSGFIMVRPRHWWTYQPVSAVVVCDQQKFQQFQLDKQFESKSCDAVKEF